MLACKTQHTGCNLCPSSVQAEEREQHASLGYSLLPLLICWPTQLHRVIVADVLCSRASMCAGPTVSSIVLLLDLTNNLHKGFVRYLSSQRA